MPSRNGSVTDNCSVCGGPKPAGRPRSTCSDACRQKAFRLRHQQELTTPELPKAKPSKPHTVYECDLCGSKLLGEQWCQDCAKPMRRLGPGGLCPCCSEPLTFQELLES
jgi:hypothetical protein